MKQHEWNNEVLELLEELRFDYAKNHSSKRRLDQYAKVMKLIETGQTLKIGECSHG